MSTPAASLRLELPDEALDDLAERIAARIQPVAEAASPWMTFEELVEYTKIPGGTLRKLTARGEIPGHGPRTKTYHRGEVDEALLRLSNGPLLRSAA